MKSKNGFKIIIFLTAIMIALTSFAAAVPARAAADSKDAMQQYVDAMQPGWNLGNTFDATPGGETSWGNPATTKALIDHIAAAGFKSIRIPITWDQRTGPAPDYKIDKQFMDRIQQVVDWSLSDGLYVLINLHHDSQWVMKMPTQHDEVMQKYNALWTQIAGHFKNESIKLSFESINEPRFSDDWGKDDPDYFKWLDQLNTSFVHIVRKSGGKNNVRPLVLPTLTASASQKRLDALAKTMTKLNDHHLIATIHYYGYWPFSVNVAGSTTFDAKAKDDVDQTFDRAHKTFVAKGIPVLMGEFGLLGFDTSMSVIEHGEILKFFEYMTNEARKQDVTLMLWDNGQHFDRNHFVWKDPLIYKELMAGMKGRSSTAESDSLYIQKGQPLKDHSMQLNLHGNTFKDLIYGGKPLSAGTDYALNGDQLVFKASLLKRLLTGKTGTNAIVTCKFSAGADWKINVISYALPQLKDAKGSSYGLTIPTQFNGDQLSSMEAVYAKGGNAGPNNWTSFKQMAVSFTPDNAGNTIKLSEKFFDQTKDGKIILTFHFWSGDAIKYTLTKDQSKVTGVSSQVAAKKQTTASESSKKSPDAAKKSTAAPVVEKHTTTVKKTGFGPSAYIETGLALLLLAAIGITLKNSKKG